MFKVLRDDHPDLLTKCKPPPTVEFAIELAEDMIVTMQAYGGIGLAANQVGVCWRVIVMDVSKTGKAKHTLINPIIIKTSKNKVLKPEGCLSYPNQYIDKERFEWVRVKYVNHKGRDKVKTFRGLEAIVISHEIDHLNGVSFLGDKS